MGNLGSTETAWWRAGHDENRGQAGDLGVMQLEHGPRVTMPQGETHHFREPCQGRKESWWGFLLTIDGVEDEHEVPAFGLDDLFEHPG